MLTAFWEKTKQLMDHSVFFRVIEWLMNFLARFFGGSFLVKPLANRESGEQLHGSAIFRAAQAVLSLPERARDSWGRRLWQGSFIGRLLRTLPQAALSLKLRHIGAGTLAGAAVYYVLIIGAGGESFIITPLSACVIAAGTVALFIKTDFYTLLLNSVFMRFLCYVFDFGLPRFKPQKSYVALPVLYGAAAGFAFWHFPPLWAAAALVAPFAALIVAAYPFVGVLALVFGMPYLPTMVIAALIVALWAVFLFKLLTDTRYALRLDLTGLFVLSFILITLFKGFTSLHRETSLNIALLTSLFMSVYLLVANLACGRRKIEILIFTFTTAALGTGLYGLLQAMSGGRDTRWVDKEVFEELGRRVYSTFANPNVFGTYLLLAIPIAVAGFVLAKRVLLKLYYAAVCAVLFINLGLTYSRGCYLAIVLAIVVAVLLLEKRLVVLLSAGVFILPAVLPQSMFNRLMSVTSLADSSSVYRTSIYQASLRILQRIWFVGIGQGAEAFNRLFPLYAFNAVTAQHSHNLFLQIFIETGIFGFAAFLGILYCTIKTLYPCVKVSAANTKTRVLAAALLAALAAFVLQSLFDYTFYNYRVYMLFFVALGLGQAVGKAADER